MLLLDQVRKLDDFEINMDGVLANVNTCSGGAGASFRENTDSE